MDWLCSKTGFVLAFSASGLQLQGCSRSKSWLAIFSLTSIKLPFILLLAHRASDSVLIHNKCLIHRVWTSSFWTGYFLFEMNDITIFYTLLLLLLLRKGKCLFTANKTKVYIPVLPCPADWRPFSSFHRCSENCADASFLLCSLLKPFLYWSVCPNSFIY